MLKDGIHKRKTFDLFYALQEEDTCSRQNTMHSCTAPQLASHNAHKLNSVAIVLPLDHHLASPAPVCVKCAVFLQI